jgi:hypothetical protein
MEMDRIVNLACDRASSLSAPGTAVNMPEGQIGPGSEQHPPTEDWNCEQNVEPPQNEGGVSVLDQSVHPEGGGDVSVLDQSVPPEGGGGGDRNRQNNRQTETREWSR